MVKNKKTDITYFGIFPSWLLTQIQFSHGLLTINSTQNPPLYVRLNSHGSISIGKGAELLYGLSEHELECGPFGLPVLNYSSGYSCECLYGYRPTSSEEFSVGNYTGGCVRNVSWSCQTDSIVDSERFMFHQVDNLLMFSRTPGEITPSLSIEECKTYCLKNCTCVAFASREVDCYLLYGELLSITTSDDMLTGMSIYIRLVVSPSPTPSPISSNINRNIKLIIGGVSISVIVTLLFIWIFVTKFMWVKLVSVDDYLSVYTFRQMKNATKSFSTKLGEGGFGSVFRGQLLDCTEVAVKKLKMVVQEEKQFRAEVQTLGMVRHTNLVRLLGFCAEGRRRLLVYEYMPGGSLDSHLFSKTCFSLSWNTRYKIAIGTARGLAYLHEECRDCIIHCDIKPENVLLDEHFCPKIADFGLAKLLGRDFSCVLTTMRGTIGYLAPEWISGEPITRKADVYSFGMMLFEILYGKRNITKFNNKRYPYFPLYATVKINEGEVLCLVDERLEKNVNVVELTRACNVAGWCIQDSEAHRPSMGKVVLMLQGVINVDIPPVPRSLLNLLDADDY